MATAVEIVRKLVGALPEAEFPISPPLGELTALAAAEVILLGGDPP